jgi:hypothetical protein
MTEPAVAPTPTTGDTQPALPMEPVAAPVEPTPTPAPTDWRTSLPADLQNHPTLSDTKSVESLARQHIESAAMIGRKGIIPPADDSPEEQTRYLNQLGRPESADLYKFESVDLASRTPETIGFLDSLRPSFHARGLTDSQADGITKDWLDVVAQDQADKAQANDERAKITTADLQKKWGMAFEARREMAARAGKHLFGEETLSQFAEAKLPDGSRIGDHPDFIEKLYDNLGAHMTEDELVSGSAASSVMTPESAQAEIDRLLVDKDFAGSDGPYYNTNHPEHQAAQGKMKSLYAMVSPPQ